MYWKEDTGENTQYTVPDDVVDLVYKINCRSLPLDHAYDFSTALIATLPWIADEPEAGVHLIHGAESGNGWFRPEDAKNELLHLSHRSKMTLRVPKHRVEDAHKLTDAVLTIQGHELKVGKAKVKLFSALPTQFARYLVVPDGCDAEDEAGFMQHMADELKKFDIKVRKMLCGLNHRIHHPQGDLITRSLMLADMEVEEAIALQQHGLGEHKMIGCGLFIPHKGISAVHEMNASKKKD